MIGLLVSGAFLWVALGAAEEDAYSFCVDQNGNVRLLSQSAKPGDAPVKCRRNERLIEVPSEARIADLEATFETVGAALADVLAALGVAETDIEDLQGSAVLLGASLADVLAALGLAEADIAALQEAADAMGMSLADILAAMLLAQADIAGLQDAVDGLEGRVAALESPPTPTPTPTPTATPTPTPTPTPPPTPTPTPLPPLQQQIVNILGPTGVILPLVDPSDPSSFTTIGAAAAVFTWSPGPFESPVTLQGPAAIPIITFNGTDEMADSPDADFWSVDDSGDAGFSLGIWARLTATPANVTLLSKWGASGNREWAWDVNVSDRLELYLSDNSVGAFPVRRGQSNIAQDQWVFLVVTYDGRGGGSAADGITHYVDGVVQASTASNRGSYVAMDNATEPTALGAEGRSGSPGNFFNGQMAGGPLGPWFVTHNAAGAITAAQVAELYVLGRDALGLR